MKIIAVIEERDIIEKIFKIFSGIFCYFFSNYSDLDFNLDRIRPLLIQAQHVVLVSGVQQYFKRWGVSMLSLTKSKAYPLSLLDRLAPFRIK